MSELDRIDLTALMPEKRKVITIDDKAGEKYDIELFIPPAALPALTELRDDLVVLMAGNPVKKFSPGHLKAMIRILEVVVLEQYPFMNAEWINRNISMARLLMIIYQLAAPLQHQFAYLTEMGILGGQKETAGPTKEQSD